MKDYLPIGSIVRLSGGTKRVMIFGRRIVHSASGTVFDYTSCLYPEGFMDIDNCFLFNHERIEEVYHLGFQDEEELAFSTGPLQTVSTPPTEG